MVRDAGYAVRHLPLARVLAVLDVPRDPGGGWRCPSCAASGLLLVQHRAQCHACGRWWHAVSLARAVWRTNTEDATTRLLAACAADDGP